MAGAAAGRGLCAESLCRSFQHGGEGSVENSAAVAGAQGTRGCAVYVAKACLHPDPTSLSRSHGAEQGALAAGDRASTALPAAKFVNQLRGAELRAPRLHLRCEMYIEFNQIRPLSKTITAMTLGLSLDSYDRSSACEKLSSLSIDISSALEKIALIAFTVCRPEKWSIILPS
mmetsp:Transcript_26747/g.61088  ORF Transcript_26747/g.61088 Transcript_26747/m.61088 type:complete len:173 (+) Transcript_26747:2480-2998(+)